MSTTTLAGKQVGTTGFGLMRLAIPGGPSSNEAIAIMKAALERGCNFWNGAEHYGTPQRNSLHLLREYFTEYPEDADKVVLSIKGAQPNHQPDCSPEAIRQSVDNCNAILAGTKSIDIFACARVDKKTPVEVSMATLKELVDEGKIGSIGMSEVGVEKIERALKVAPIAAVELDVSIMSDDIFHNGVSRLCAKHNIPIIGYGVLSRGLLLFQSTDDAPSFAVYSSFPRFQPDALEKNMKLIREIRAVADEKGCSMAQLCINWVKHMSKRNGNAEIIPIPASTAISRVHENTVDVSLSAEDMERIDGILERFEVVGERYPPQIAATWET